MQVCLVRSSRRWIDRLPDAGELCAIALSVHKPANIELRERSAREVGPGGGIGTNDVLGHSALISRCLTASGTNAINYREWPVWVSTSAGLAGKARPRWKLMQGQ